MTIKTVNIAPTWTGLYPLFEQFIKTGSMDQKEYVCQELKKLCQLADAVNKKNEKAGK